MMEEGMQLAEESDLECLAIIPSPNPLSGQEIVDYLDKNRLTIVDIDVLKERKQLEVQLKEFQEKEKQLEDELKEKENEWAKEREGLKSEVQRLQFRKDFWSGYNDKLLGCIRKIAEATEFRRLKQFPMKEDAKCEFIREELLKGLSNHVEEKFAELKNRKKKDEVPVCDDKLMEPKKEVAVKEDCSPKLAPWSASTMSMTSSSLEKPEDNIVKKNLLPSSPCDQAPKPVVPKLIIKIAGQDKQTSVSVKSQRKHSFSESSTATLSSWKSEKPTKKKAKKSANDSIDEKPQPSPREKVVNAINRKLKSATLPLPAVLSLPKAGSSKASSSSSSSARSKGPTATKWKCDKCTNRFNSNRAYKEHRTVAELILVETKDHNQSLPVFLPKKSRKFVSPPTSIPVPTLGFAKTMESADERSFLSLSSSDSDEDMPTAAGASSPQLPEAKSTDADAGSVNCHVCGDIFRTMAALNFHCRKKHPGNGGPTE